MQPEKMSDDDIVVRLTYAVSQAVGLGDTKLAREREQVRKYYEGELPARVTAGDSNYVSMDVFDGTEAMKAQLIEAALATHRPVIFTPGMGETDEQAGARTEWCDQVLYDKNKGFKLLGTAVDDALRNRNAIVKVWWDKHAAKETYDLTDVSAEALEAHLAEDPNREVEDYTEHQDGLTFKRVRLTQTVDRSQVRIENVAPEEFGISPQATSIEKAMCVHKRRMTVSELLKAGYPKDKVLELQSNEKLWDSEGSDLYGRFQETDDSAQFDSQDGDMSKARSRCTIYEVYDELDIDGSGESYLYKVTFAGSTLLDKERVDRKPFLDFCPLPRPHAFWGANFAKLLIQTQTTRTYLTRSIVNHALITNNPRLQVVRGAVMNPRELTDNRIGGLVNVTRENGIMPIPQSGLNPFVFQTIAMLDDNKEQLTGISKLSQGLNKDAISNQNSQGMVNDLINVGQTRQRVVVRNWCENFLRPLYTMVYQLSYENEDQSKVARVAGAWQPIDFTSWPQDSQAQVQISLGPEAQKEETQKWLVFHKLMSTDGDFKPFYPQDKQFNVLKRIMKAGGISDWDQYIITPQEVKPPPPDPMQQAELALKQADTAVKTATAQATTANMQLKQQELGVKQSEFSTKMAFQARKETDHTQLATDKLSHEVSMDAAELQMEQQAQAAGALEAKVQLSG